MKNLINKEVKFEDVNPKNRLVVSKTDIKGNILYANKIFAELSGYSKEELIVKTL